MTQSRYVLPSFTERTAYGTKETNPYFKLFEERIVFLGTPVDDETANNIMAQLIYLESDNPDRDIIMYINSPGGSFTAMTAIYDTMQFVRSDIQTVCLGLAASAAAVILAAGSPGKRFVLPNSTALLHQPSHGGTRGQVTDLEIQAQEIQRMRLQMERILAGHTGRSAEQVRTDLERDLFLPAKEAVEYGIADEILPYRKLSALK